MVPEGITLLTIMEHSVLWLYYFHSLNNTGNYMYHPLCHSFFFFLYIRPEFLYIKLQSLQLMPWLRWLSPASDHQWSGSNAG